MPPSATETDSYKLLFHIVNQLEKQNLINKNINWAEMSVSLGAKIGTVQKRWQVLKKKEHIGQDGAEPSVAADEGEEGEEGGKGKKTAVGKKRANGGAANGEPKAKKGKTAGRKVMAKAEPSAASEIEDEARDEDSDAGNV